MTITQVTTLAYEVADRRRMVPSFGLPIYMGPGFSHAAVFFAHSSPFRTAKLWREPV